MPTLKRTLLSSVTALLVIACICAGDPAQAGQNAKPRPFKAVGVAVWDNLFAGFNPETGASFVGSGHGTHLGKFDQTGSLFFTGPPDGAGLIPGVGSVVLVAANGDELHFDYDGVLDSLTGIGEGTLTFTGGTGRFAGASGDGAFYAEIDISSGPVNAPMEVWLTGELAY